MPISFERMQKDLEILSSFTDPEKPYTRRSFSPLYEKARQWLWKAMKEAGLSPRLDEAANLIGVREGAEAGLPPLIMGSHIDTVEGGGRFDGTAGVVTALEVARSLFEDGHVLRHPLWVVDFLAEEPSPYGPSTVGSRAMAGRLRKEDLERRNEEGETLREAIARMGGKPQQLGEPLVPPGAIAAYLELHIEQGPLLERAGVPLGIVTGIVGIDRYRLEVRGEQGHAGTVPMKERKDSLLALAEVLLEVEAFARRKAEEVPFVATMGWVKVHPNHENVIPGRVEAVLEMRSLAHEALEEGERALRTILERVEERRGVTLRGERTDRLPPTLSDPRLMDLLKEAAEKRGLSFLELPSGAGHDAMHMAALGPMAMVFIPCRGGKSHVAEEWADVRHMALGAQVLRDVLLRLDHEDRRSGPAGP